MYLLTLMSSLLISINGFGFPVASQNFTNTNISTTTCSKDDCFQNGWVTKAPNTHHRTRCTEGDCLHEGWVTRDMINNYSTEVVCDRDGCFNEGWSEYVVHTGQRVSQVDCGFGEDIEGEEIQDCLQFGWTMDIVNQPTQSIVCLDDNCSENGWSIYLGRRQAAEVVCTSASCFEKGWRVFY